MAAVDESRRRRALTEANSVLSEVSGAGARAAVDGEDAGATMIKRFHACVTPKLAAAGFAWDDLCALAVAMCERCGGGRVAATAADAAEAALRRVLNGAAIVVVGRYLLRHALRH